MGEYKRNHWVPKSYLRAFAADAKREKIWVFGKTHIDPVLKPISNVAVKFYLYTPSQGGERDSSFEKKLSELEQLFGLPLWKQISTDFVDLSSEPVRKGISLLAAVMYLRNPTVLDQVTAMYTQFRSSYLQDGVPDAVEIGGKIYETDTDSWPAYRDASEDDIKRMWLNTLGGAAWLAELMMKMRWAVIASEQPVFITSDNPVTIIHPSLEFRGLKDAETSVLFPLSPTRMLYLDNRHSEPDAQYYAVRGRGEEHNALVWRNAIENMFTHRHPDEVCAEMIAIADGADAARVEGRGSPSSGSQGA